MYSQILPLNHPLPKPSPQQIRWQNRELGILIHMDTEIFAQKFPSIGQPFWPASKFNPTELDTDQWCSIAKEAGARYVVLTSKHLSGFTLFPNEVYDYPESVKYS